MKTKLSILTSLLLALSPALWAQNAAFTAGTNELAETNLSAAYSSFASAVAQSPTDPDANVYYAMTRLLVLPSLSSGSSFLTHLGIGASGRNIYNWTASRPTNSHGHIVISSGIYADDFTAQLRNNIVPALIAAQTNLAQITETNFTLLMPREVTHLATVTIDYGDVLMLRAMLNAGELYGYYLYSLNLHAQITAVSNIAATDQSIEAILSAYPAAFTFATTSDKAAAQAAFSSAANLYLQASDFIRNVRPTNETYLFNLGADETSKELDFRQLLTNLLLSLNGTPEPLPKSQKVSIDLAAFFSDATSLRSLLPEIDGRAFVWDSWPDATLGGVVFGLSSSNFDKGLVHLLNAEEPTQVGALKVLASFSNAQNPFGSPQANNVILAKDGNLYGTTQYGGTYSGFGDGYQGAGSIFKVVPSTGVMTVIYDFDSNTNDPDGNTPNALIQGADGELYGTTEFGTANYGGTVFKTSTSGGSTFKTLYTFGSQGNGNDGYTPMAALVQDKRGVLWGTTQNGGDSGYGTVFSISTAGNYTNVHSFTGGDDGANPAATLLLASDGNLYGTTASGGTNSFGTIFEVVLGQGTPFVQPIYSFGAINDGMGNAFDGSMPNGLAQGSDGNLYGTTQSGGTNDLGYGNPVSGMSYGGDGTAFRLSKVNGNWVFTSLLSFDQQGQDGFNPVGSLVQGTNGVLYGVTENGGANNRGSIFALKTSGALSSVVWFTKDSGGYQNDQYYFQSSPPGGLTRGSDGNFYGSTTSDGLGKGGNGTVFRLSSILRPTFITEPANVTVAVGSTATLQTTASASGNLTYQWEFDSAKLANGTHVSGATAATLNLLNVTPASAGSYKVIVTDSSGSVTSAVATVTVIIPASITKAPASQAEPLGGTAKFTVTAGGALPLSFSWYFDGQPLSDGGDISGSATSNLTIVPVLAQNVGSYVVVVSNQFGLASNSSAAVLTLKPETTKVVATITTPSAGARTTNSTMAGTATDTVRVEGVRYWLTNLNNGVKITNSGQAVLSAGAHSALASNWVIQTSSLLPGTNILTVQSYNYSGSNSPFATSEFFYQVPTTFTLSTNPFGSGKITATASITGNRAPSNGASLYVGESYTVTAIPANTNWWFTNWTSSGSVVSSNRAYTFVMEPGLSLTANFVTNLFIGMAGRYDGIFDVSDLAGPSEQTSGMIGNLQLLSNGTYSAKLYLAGVTNSISGSFNMSGQSPGSVSRKPAQGGLVTYLLNLQWDSTAPPRQITGWVQGTNAGGWIASNLVLYAARTNNGDLPAYTLLLQSAETSDAAVPPGYGYVLITNNTKVGLLNMAGALADGSPYSQSVPVAEDNAFPVYASLYTNGGLLLGRLSLSADVDTNLTWIKPPVTKGIYTNGFTNQLVNLLSPWTNSAAAVSNLFHNGGALILSDGGLAPNLVFAVALTSSNTLRWVSGPTNFTGGSINLSNGLLTVNFINDSGKKTNAYGAVLQNAAMGGGYFLGATNAGAMTLTQP
jgi:uncharacterized repeat protein (TIGR03803 family)